MTTDLSWAADLVAALGSLDELKRDKTASVAMKSGGNYSYNYADLGSILGYVRPILLAHNYAHVQHVRTVDRMVEVRTDLIHDSGYIHEGSWLGLPMGNDPQSTGSAITYARRYSLLAALGMATEDDDGKAAQRSTQPAPSGQTAHEVQARRLLAGLPANEQRLVQQRFKEHFGCTLSQLPRERHGEAVNVIQDAIDDLHADPPEVAGGGYDEG